MAQGKRVVSVLGSTGSIGVNTLDVIGRHPDRYQVHALAAHTSVETMLSQCQAFKPRYAVMMDESAADPAPKCTLMCSDWRQAGASMITRRTFVRTNGHNYFRHSCV